MNLIFFYCSSVILWGSRPPSIEIPSGLWAFLLCQYGFIHWVYNSPVVTNRAFLISLVTQSNDFKRNKWNPGRCEQVTPALHRSLHHKTLTTSLICHAIFYRLQRTIPFAKTTSASAPIAATTTTTSRNIMTSVSLTLLSLSGLTYNWKPNRHNKKINAPAKANWNRLIIWQS